PLQPPGLGSANTTCSGTQYDIPNRRITAKSMPLRGNFFKSSALRGPLTPQTCFAAEQLVDELAHAARRDPVEFRLANISTQQVGDGFNQWRHALVAVARLAHWQPRVAAAALPSGDVVTGRGA